MSGKIFLPKKCFKSFLSLRCFKVGVGYSVGLLIFESVCCMIFFSCKFYIINRFFYLLCGCLTVNFWDTIKGTACTPKKQKIRNISVRLKYLKFVFLALLDCKKDFFNLISIGMLVQQTCLSKKFIISVTKTFKQNLISPNEKLIKICTGLSLVLFKI